MLDDRQERDKREREWLETIAACGDDPALPFEVRECSVCHERKAILKGRENCTACRHTLTVSDLQRMNVPEEFWRATFSAVTESVRTVVGNYLRNLPELLREGAGLYLFGPPGVGKTGAAVVLLKAARERFRTGYFVRVGELRDAIRDQSAFDADQSIVDRARDVDVLVLDSLVEPDLKLPYLGFDGITDLVVQRGQRSRVTLLTATVSVSALTKHGPWAERVGSYLVPTHVTGEDRRQERLDRVSKLLHEGAPESKRDTKKSTKGGR